MNRSYVIISPCRDEAQYMRRTLDSVLAQTALPSLWVIVDDGSTDETPAILDAYAARHAFIQVIRRTDRGRRSVGPGVVDAFYAGLELVVLLRFDYA
jgi:biofilm PGA synthesis N-glycosyltransferase PgaC